MPKPGRFSQRRVKPVPMTPEEARKQAAEQAASREEAVKKEFEARGQSRGKFKGGLIGTAAGIAGSLLWSGAKEEIHRENQGPPATVLEAQRLNEQGTKYGSFWAESLKRRRMSLNPERLAEIEDTLLPRLSVKLDPRVKKNPKTAEWVKIERLLEFVKNLDANKKRRDFYSTPIIDRNGIRIDSSDHSNYERMLNNQLPRTETYLGERGKEKLENAMDISWFFGTEQGYKIYRALKRVEAKKAQSETRQQAVRTTRGEQSRTRRDTARGQRQQSSARQANIRGRQNPNSRSRT